jgi:RNA polymerase sigma factor (sigma-70 family)
LIAIDNMADAELVALARSGDKSAFGQLIERYQQMVKRIALGMIANEDIARELAQEAILQAYLSLDHLRDNTRFKSWLYGITLNICKSYIREQKTDPYSLEALMGGMRCDVINLSLAALDPEEAAEERELHRLVLNAVQTLSPKERAATLLFYYEQLTLQEIAAILEVSVVAVKGRLHRARKQLREQLSAVYADLRDVQYATSSEQRRKTMIKVNIVDVINLIGQQGQSRCTVVLLDEPGRRAVPIWIGQSEGVTISMILHKNLMPRPMTINFTASILAATGSALEEVRIETLKEDVFYAVAKIRSGNTTQELDARPSDALALALLMDSPVYIAEEVLEKCGIALPEGKTLHRLEALDELSSQGGEASTEEERERLYRGALRMLMVDVV